MNEKKVIVVFDVPAVNGGALSILKMYYEKAVLEANENQQYVFVVSTPSLEEKEFVKVIKYSWVKKSWLHRIYFDKFVAFKIFNENGGTEILSLQNIVVSKVSAYQELYMHQSLPFIEHRFNIIAHPKLWIYQNIIGKIIKKSIKKANKIIVQTGWIKDAIIKQCKVSEDKIVIEPPMLDMGYVKQNEHNKSNEFFYPASSFFYKNHDVIVRALILLSKENRFPKVTFTLNENDNKLTKKIVKLKNKYQLNIELVGVLSKKKVFEMYSKSVLLFPSYVETFGLPLLEAKLSDCDIICSNTLFSKEILCGYEKANFFEFNNADQLVSLMREYE